MPTNDPEKQRRYWREHYARNKDTYRARNDAQKAAARQHTQAIKATTPCTDCGVQYPWYVMDFDHLSEKVRSISAMVTRGASLATIDKEIAKCEVVCSNCHRIRTYTRAHSGVV